MFKKSITVEIYNVYYQDLVYPMCETSKLFARLAGTKTLTPRAIETIKELGYKINVHQRIVTL